MSGTLFVVATPIGNLEDITFRAVRVLREAHVIAAEDTRRTVKLLARYGVTTPAVSFHQHNTRSRLPQLIRRLERGENIALVTDAGTPGISDPGTALVDACLSQGIPVDPVPGPSAALTAATASGFPLEPLTIFGFAPARSKARTAWLEELQAIGHTFTFFEAPHRIRQTLTDLGRIFGNRPILVARELTKVHQQVIRGTASDILGHVVNAKGEFTIVVGPSVADESAHFLVSDREIAAEFWRSTDNGPGGRRRAVVNLARKYNRSTREIYGIIEKHKNSVV